MMNSNQIETATLNCDQAEISMLKYAEKTIQPAEASKLAHHVLGCGTCREYYLLFDEIVEAAATNLELHEPPVNFTAIVMANVRATTQPRASMLHLLWGVSAILLGVALFLAYNPALLAQLTHAFPAVSGAVYSIMAYMGNALDYVIQSAGAHTVGNHFGIAALVFVLMLSSLLVVLHREEEATIA